MRNYILFLQFFVSSFILIANEECNITNWENYYPNLQGCQLAEAYLVEMDFSNVDLSYANLYRVDFTRTNLSGSTLDFAEFVDGNLSEANLDGASLVSINLHKTHLNMANAPNTNFYNSDLSETIITNANLENSILVGVDFNGSNLEGTSIEGSCLEGVINFNQTNYLGSPIFEGCFLETLLVPDQFSSIQSAIDASTDGDTVYVASGEYYENINFNGKNIAVIGEDRDNTIINGGNIATVVTFHNNGDSNNPLLSDFTIINGNANGGGHHEGGGIWCNNSHPTLNNLIIKNNNSGGHGGGIYILYSNIDIVGSHILNNTALNGAGIYVEYESNLNIINSSINFNSALNGNSDGGGLLVNSSSIVNISESDIQFNNASDDGGGIYLKNNSSIYLDKVLINNNYTQYAGGAICMSSLGENNYLNINNSTFNDNISIQNYDFSHGLMIRSGNLFISNSIINEISNNIENNTSDHTIIYTLNHSNWEGDGNFDSDPQFTDPENGDFTLQPTSPCIDAGDPNSPLEPDGTIADMGAYYYDQIENPMIVLGCIYESACNYDPDATEDDGNCIYAEEYYDCNGFCFNDEDSDLICDELDDCIGDYDICGECNGNGWDTCDDGGDPEISNYDEWGYGPHSIIVEDVPEDDGGRVYITFNRSFYDTDTLNRNNEDYTIERLDDENWVGVGFQGAYGSDYYQVEILTLDDNIETEFRIIANMDEGNFISFGTAIGYSIDNNQENELPLSFVPEDYLSFDGDDYITINNSDSFNPGYSDFTILSWIKLSETLDRGGYIRKRHDTTKWYQIYYESNGKIFYEIASNYNSMPYTRCDCEIPINDNEWHFVAVVFDRDGNGTIYIDGEFCSEQDITSQYNDLSINEELIIGKASENWPHQGYIDETSFFMRALSIEEINFVMNNNLIGNEEDLIGYWKFELDVPENVLIDNSGNENHGIIYGATWVENIYGCTNEYAQNYNPVANLDDGSCEYAPLLDVFNYIGELNGNSYYISTFTANWFDSKIICESYGGYLATISNTEENSLIASQYTNGNYIWIGFTDEEDEGNWQWITDENVSYTNWKTSVGEPNNQGGNEHYAWIQEDYTWNDAVGNSLVYFALEIENILGCTDELACNYNQEANEDDGSCYFPEENYDCNGNCNDESILIWDQCYSIENTTNLNLNESNLSGEIPIEITFLINLDTLDLSYNYLSGEIPEEIDNLNSLTKLWLQGNNLEGEIPIEITNLDLLEVLDLGGNFLEGQIPNEIGNLTSLTHLYLQNNNLDSTIPNSICQLSLEFNENHFNIDNNQLCPPYPDCLSNEDFGSQDISNCNNNLIYDFDGNEYQIVQIGDQIWMKENLKVTHYNDGSTIPTGLDNSSWSNTSQGAYSSYGNVNSVGYLYNWYVVNDERGICPEGFHVPTDDDWKELELFLEMSINDINSSGCRGENENYFLKDEDLWNGNNETGFSALPSGHRQAGGSYYSINTHAYYWTSTMYDEENSWRRDFGSDSGCIYRQNNHNNNYGFSIRCLEDQFINGCIDELADNYNSDANWDDGSCIYPDDKDYSLSFDGMDDWVNINYNETLNITNNLSINMKFNYLGTELINDTYVGVITSWVFDDASSSGYGVNFIEDGRLEVISPTNHLWNQFQSINSLVKNTNYQVTIVYNNGIAELYIDGVYINSRIYNGPINEIQGLAFGSDINGNHHFNGILDNVTIWDYALNQEEINSNLLSNTIGNENGLVGFWKFNSGEGNILYDHTGNQNHGNIFGASWIDNSINQCCFELQGDVDCNTVLDISDVIILIDMILGQGQHSEDQNKCGDIDNNGDIDPIIDISDLVILVETILNN